MKATGHTVLISTATSETPRPKIWIYHLPYCSSASGKIKQYNGLLKATLRARDTGTFRHWDNHLAKAIWLVNTRKSGEWAGPAQSKLSHTVEGAKVPTVHIPNYIVEGNLGCSCLRQRQTHPWDCSRTWECLVGNEEGWGSLICTQGDLILGRITNEDVNCCTVLYFITN